MRKYLSFLIIALTLISCKKEQVGLDVSVTGFVRLIDQAGQNVERNGVTVKIHDNPVSTLTDINGKFVFDHLKAATNYRFDFEHDGYGSKTSDQYSFIGEQNPGVIRAVTLYEQPSVEILTTKTEKINSSVLISGTLSEASNLCITGYPGLSPDVTDIKYYKTAGTINFYSTNGKTFSFHLSTLNLPTGTLYLALYLSNYYENPEYDPILGISRRSSAKKAVVLQITR